MPVVHVSSPREPQPRSNSPTATAASSESCETNSSTLNNAEAGSNWYGHPPEGTLQAFETEIFIPSYHYEDTGLEILVSDGDWRYVKERQTLYYRHKDMKPGAVHSIQIKPVSLSAGALSSLGNKNDSMASLSPSQAAMSPGSPYERSNMSKLKAEQAYGATNGKGAQVQAESDAGCVCTIM